MNVEPISFNQLGLWMSIAFLVYALHLKREANEIAKKAADQAKANGEKPSNTVITTQPLMIEMVKQFATKEEVKELEQKFEALRGELLTKIDEKFSDLDGKRSRDVAKIHNDIREVSGQVQRILGKLEK